MRQFNITGMSCAACSARVEKAVNKLDNVTKCSVSLLTNSMSVEGNATDEEVIRAVENVGYGASIRGTLYNTGSGMKDNNTSENSSFQEREAGELSVYKSRLIASLIFLIILMYFSMGHMMLGWPVFPFLEGNHVAMGILEMLLSGIIMVINQKFFINGFKGLFHRAPNMDTLVSLGASASFGYSVFVLFLMTGASKDGNTELVSRYMNDFYFESAGMILTLITVGKMLEERSKGKTKDALRSLMKLAPKTANILKPDESNQNLENIQDNNQVLTEMTIPVDEVKVNDIFVIRPGESIPVDGIVIEGGSSINESALTGESIPVDKHINDKVSAGTINISGFLKCRATRVGEDTTISQIIKMVMDASATKAPIAKIADKVSGVFVPIVMGISVITFIVWILLGYDPGFSIARAVSVLVISCPCALGLATPVAIMVGNGVGARNGILYKTSASLEEIARVDTVVLDKTGTITKGTPSVTDIFSADKDTLLSIAGSLERMSEHPLAMAVNKYIDECNVVSHNSSQNSSLNSSRNQSVLIHPVTDFLSVAGGGVSGRIDGKIYYGGNIKYICKSLNIEEGDDLVSLDEKALIDELASMGKTPLIFASEDGILGIIAVADTLKDDSIEAIGKIRGMGIKTLMLTGDNERTARAIGKMAGVDEIISDVLPDGKEEVIKNLQKTGKVLMVGDGINDAPSLARADVGMAIGAGTDVAIDAADIVLVKSRLLDVPSGILLGKKTLRNIKQNLFWAFFYNVIGIPLAAGVWYPAFGIKLNPMFGALAMSFSSFFVVSNALRLNFVKLYSKIENDKAVNNEIDNNKTEDEKKENGIMEKKMTINGMMCGHCEARVKKTLEELDGVIEAVVSHENGTAILSLSKEIDNEVLKKAVEDQGYEVSEILISRD